MEGEQGSLNGRREVIRGELRRNVMGQLKDQIYLEDEQLYEQIDTAIRQKGKETYLHLKERLWLRNSLYDSFRRLDILQELLDDKDVTEIMINGAGKIFIEKKGNMVLWTPGLKKQSVRGHYPADRRKGKPDRQCIFSHCRCQAGGRIQSPHCTAACCT